MSVKYSSITKKIWMSLMGLFLMVFLVVNLSINLLLLVDPTRELFNTAAHFMGTNPFIQTFQNYFQTFQKYLQKNGGKNQKFYIKSKTSFFEKFLPGIFSEKKSKKFSSR